MKLFLLFLTAILWPISAFSQSSQLNLQAPDTDLSVSLLSNIFGVVDGVLSGTGSQLLGNMFGVFNGAVLVLGGIVVFYTLLVSTLNTAQEGEVLGKRWSSIWIPLRSVIGVSLLIPKASGYSFIQIFMMWVVTQGVGAADSVWNVALDYLTRGGVVIQQNQKPNQSIVNNSVNILRGLTCTAMLQKQIENYRASKTPAPLDAPPNFFQGILAGIANANPNRTTTVSFPNDDNYYRFKGLCGSISWGPAQVPDNMCKTKSGSTCVEFKPEYASVKDAISNSRATGIQTLVSNLMPAATLITNNYLLSQSTGKLPIGNNDVWDSYGSSYLLPKMTIYDAAASYLGIITPTLNLLAGNANSDREWIESAKEEGWALAGKYYYNIVRINNAAYNTSTSALNFTANEPNLSPSSSNDSYGYRGNLGDSTNDGDPSNSNSPYVKNLSKLVNDNDEYSVGTGSKFITDSKNNISGQQNGTGAVDHAEGYQNGDYPNGLRQLLGALFGISSIIGGFYDLMNSQASNANPVVAIAILGSGLVSFSFGVYITFTIVMAVIAASLGAAWGFTFSVTPVTIIASIMGVINPMLLSLLVVGLTMAFYIPVVPFIIFLFGVIGWFIAVIEAIIAAPLVALGIAHPEGQEILGKAEPAVILLVNVFLRPTFMIFGLLIGMSLSYAGIWLLNKGFMDAFNSAATIGVEGLAWIFYPIAILVVYTLIALQVVQKSFSLIYLIPDEVLKWIGGNIKGMGGEAEAEHQIAGGFHSAAEAQGKSVAGMHDGVKGITEARDKENERMKDQQNKLSASSSPSDKDSSAQSKTDQSPGTQGGITSASPKPSMSSTSKGSTTDSKESTGSTGPIAKG